LSDTSDNALCLNGRALLANRTILTYFQTLVPNEVAEITFWKRYFFAKLNHERRNRLIDSQTQILGQHIPDERTNENENENETHLEAKNEIDTSSEKGDTFVMNEKRKMSTDSEDDDSRHRSSTSTEQSDWTNVGSVLSVRSLETPADTPVAVPIPILENDNDNANVNANAIPVSVSESALATSASDSNSNTLPLPLPLPLESEETDTKEDAPIEKKGQGLAKEIREERETSNGDSDGWGNWE